MMTTVLPLAILIMLSSWHLSILTLPMLMVLNFNTLFSSQNMWSSHHTMISTDNLSSMLIMLTLWITTLMLLSSTKTKENTLKSNEFHSITLTLCLLLVTTFMLNNMFSFYIFFEASLIPTLILILMWGYQPERIQAGLYMMLYTIIASMPLILSIIFLLYSSKTSSFFIYAPPLTMNKILISSLSLAFLVKLPIYSLHLWLPKAHVEAPVAGSMILAGVLLKLGGYGLMRMVMMHPHLLSMSSLFVVTSLWGGSLTTIVCIRQLDMKSMIAYSSVSHMALVIMGIYSNSSWGWTGAVMMMLSHALSSSCLFALANMYYENTNTRSLFISKGLLFISPSMTLWWMLLTAANMAAPPTINLLSEIMLISSAINYSHMSLLLIMMISFFTMAYSITLFISMHHGPPSEHLNFMNTIQIYFSISFLHAVPLFIMILCPDLISW